AAQRRRRVLPDLQPDASHRLQPDLEELSGGREDGGGLGQRQLALLGVVGHGPPVWMTPEGRLLRAGPFTTAATARSDAPRGAASPRGGGGHRGRRR